MTLDEAILYDYIGEGTLLHYTTPEALASILKKGKLYVGKDGLNTIRPSAASKENVDSMKQPKTSHGRPSKWQTRDSRDRRTTLSSKDWSYNKYNAKEEQSIYDSGKNSIKIIIDGSKLKSGELRGLKIEKKNNANEDLMQQVKHSLDSILDGPAEKFIKEVAPYVNKFHTKNGGKKLSPSEVNDLISTIPKDKKDALSKKYGLFHNGKVYSAIKAAYEYRNAARNRKGTEIVKYKDNKKFSSIPVNAKFMKFEFLHKPTMKDNDMIALAKHIDDNRELFKNNDVLKDIMKTAKMIENGEKPEKKTKPIKIKKAKVKEKPNPYHINKDNGKGFEVY